MSVDDQRNSNPLFVGPHIFFRPIPSYVDARVLGIGAAEDFTVPVTAGYVVFSATEDFYVSLGTGTATVPVDTADGTASELNPVGYTVKGGEILSVISSAVCTITMTVYDKPQQ